MGTKETHPARGLFTLGLMLGAAVGAAIGLLYAPKPGSGSPVDPSLWSGGADSAGDGDELGQAADGVAGPAASPESPL